ncbi:phosphoenolpyruvate--protein phosphotransferase [Paraburkholderia sp. J41]|uniref:phosphoenolpyruvate--protein phosphotransferase n=1 Tax=Paraburkholderia sp. J41 TaxID=2805433 RepID=UPI002AC34A63|nr:phosphoenolpyruvate--protein phosphotransferase [Paraburkholderia sp. J41]
MLETPVIVKVREGLHARPATQFAKLAKGFSCSLKIGRGESWADAKSAVKLMLLGVKQDERIVLRAEGEDEREAVGKLAEFLADANVSAPAVEPADARTDARADAEANAQASAEASAQASAEAIAQANAQTNAQTSAQANPAERRALKGVAASEGVAFGAVFAYFREEIVADRQFVAPHEVDSELARFGAALEDTLRAMLAPREGAQCDDETDDEIFAAIADVARSDDFAGAIRTLVASRWSAEAATLKCGLDLAVAFATLPDEYLKSRADDIRGLTRAVAAALLGKPVPSLSGLPGPSIVIAEELSAPDLARADLRHVAGIVCTSGSATSHVAIIARSHGIPAVLGLDAHHDAHHDALRAATRAAIDGGSGEVWLDPAPELEAAMRRRSEAQREADAALLAYRDVEPRTRDGRPILVAANLGSVGEIEPARCAGAMGVGLFRTELLFMDRQCVPGEDEQYAVYAELASAFAPWPVIIRTLDAGADKPLPGVRFPKEENPFLGWRGIRMCLDSPAIFEPQLRALLRAAVHGNLRVMLPMVDDVDEVRRVKAIMARVATELAAANVPHALPQLGIMVETPAAVLTADALAREVAFFSIGTNDLTQYIMAVDRMNPNLASLYRTDHPAVLQAIRMVCGAARRAGIGVGVCGEAASRPELIPALVNLGVDELSMSPQAILRAKKCVTEIEPAPAAPALPERVCSDE